MTRLYVSGPISSDPSRTFEEKRAAFYRAADRLSAAGFEVVNPLDVGPHCGQPDGQCPVEERHVAAAPEDKQAKHAWECFMRGDIVDLMDCDGVATLEKWETSAGARIEVGLAWSLNMPVKGVNDWCGPPVPGILVLPHGVSPEDIRLVDDDKSIFGQTRVMPVGVEGEVTTDGRLILPDVIELPTRPIPVTASGWYKGAGWEALSRVCGRADDFHRRGREIWCTVSVISEFDMHLPDLVGGMELDQTEHFEREGLTVITKGRLRGLALLSGIGSNFPSLQEEAGPATAAEANPDHRRYCARCRAHEDAHAPGGARYGCDYAGPGTKDKCTLCDLAITWTGRAWIDHDHNSRGGVAEYCPASKDPDPAHVPAGSGEQR
jgi:hypothetical protein